jgi:glycosyltransferase involved in cell wall biosynthesis
MRIGIIGSRGIPNNYGGFEQFAQYLSVGLVRKRHEVFVYSSSLHPFRENHWHGVTIIHCKDWEDKLGASGQFFYDLNCINDARRRNFDVLLQLGYTSNSIWHWRWPRNSINIVHMDGLEWKRQQYSKFTRMFLKRAEAWAARYADQLIADSPAIREHLLKEYNVHSAYISYGADIFDAPNPSLLKELNLQPHHYYLIVARMEPENNIEMIITGYLQTQKEDPLIIVGNAQNQFGKQWMKKYKNERIKFAGAIYDHTFLNNLRFFSKIYFHGHSAGGTNPSLLEAMACSCNIAAHDNVFNRSVLCDNATYFSSAEEVKKLIYQGVEPHFAEKNARANLQKIKVEYNWSKVTEQYEQLFLNVMLFKESKKMELAD